MTVTRIMYEDDRRFGRYPYVIQPGVPVDADTLVAALANADVNGTVVFEDGTVRTYSYEQARRTWAVVQSLLTPGVPVG